MQGVMVVPGRRGMGYIRGLGQDYSPDSPSEVDPSAGRDIPYVIPVGGFGLQASTDEELKRLYIFAQTAVAVRAKSAFLSQLSMVISGDPTLMGFYRSTSEGQAFINALTAAKGFFLAITQPNIRTSLQNLAVDLEVNHLVKRGYSITGRVATYVNGATDLSYADTTVKPPPGVEVKGSINFGDFSKTNLYDDVNALRLIAINMKVDGMPSLGAGPILTAAVVIAVIKYVIFPLIVAIGLYAAVDKLTTKSISIDLPPDFAKLSPEVQKMILKAQSVLQDVQDVLKWFAVALGVVVVGGTVFYFSTKD